MNRPEALPGLAPFVDAATLAADRLSKTSSLLLAASQSLGYEHLVESEFGVVGRIEAKGRSLIYRGGLLGINSAGASALCRDKAYCASVLQAAGVPLPKMCSFFSPDFDAFAARRGTAAALRFASQLGYPVFVKPNEGTRSFGACRADDDDQLAWALERSFLRREGRVSLVQDFIEGSELRLLVLDGAIELAYRKQPIWICGDGEARLSELLEALRAKLVDEGRKVFKPGDPRVKQSFERRGLALDSKPFGRLPLSDALSLELGGDVELITAPDEQLRTIARRSFEALGLRFGSIDLIRRPAGEALVIEVNSAPGVLGLSRLGHEREAIALYRAVLEAHFEP